MGPRQQLRMSEKYKELGIIAGNGIYPRTLATAARAAGVERLVVVAFKGETDPEIEEMVDEITWLKVGELGKMIKAFVKAEIPQAIMAGQIAPSNLYNLRPDMRTMVMLTKLKQRNAESIFGAIGDEMTKDGIDLLPATLFMEDQIPPAGHVFGPKLTEQQEEDATWGFGIAKEISRMDIGQTIVVKEGTVLAVEAFEGTNQAMKRGGELGKGKAMVIKVSKPKQDIRFDVPCIGAFTLETARESEISAIVIEGGRTIILERDQVETLARTHGISIVARAEQESSSPS